MTTQNCDPSNGINDTVNLDDSTLNYSSMSTANQQKSQKDKKVKIIAQFNKNNTSRSSTLHDLN